MEKPGRFLPRPLRVAAHSMTALDAWTHLSYSAGALVEMVGALLIYAGIAIGASSGRKTRIRRRRHQATRGEHFFRNVTDNHYRAGKL